MDDFTCSGVNPATYLSHSMANENIDFLVVLLSMMRQVILNLRLWKADVRKAFRVVPMCAEHA